MKKIEALQLAPQRSKLLIEYINQILSDEKQVNASVEIQYAKINKELMVTYEIYVPNRNFEKHLNTGITSQQENVLISQILDDLVINYLESDTIQISRFYSIRSFSANFDGVSIQGLNGTKISINFRRIAV